MGENIKRKNTENKENIPVEISDSLDKTIFFSVSEAKKRTNAVHKKRLEVQMLPVYNAINEAINDGKYSVDEIKLTDAQRVFLINKNFGVSYQKTDSYRNAYYKIYWN